MALSIPFFSDDDLHADGSASAAEVEGVDERTAEVIDLAEVVDEGTRIEVVDGEVYYLENDYADAAAVERPTSFLALAVFGIGLALSTVLVTSSPALAGVSLVAGIIGGGIMNAPAGPERRHTVAALGLPTLGLLAITAAFIASF